jgi:hypothetical protein
MRNIHLDYIKMVAVALFAGCVLGGVGHWLVTASSVSAWIFVGGLIGSAVGLAWPVIRSFSLSYRTEDWRLEEVVIHGLKFTSAGAQRRVAWRLFVEMATRISTQQMRDEEGDNGVALKSLYDLFQSTRKAISEMQPTPNATGDTVETFALDMLNSDLRPFLSKWHPVWEEFVKGGKPISQAWPDHKKFREELRELQVTIEARARGLAQLAGVQNVDRFFRQPPA